MSGVGEGTNGGERRTVLEQQAEAVRARLERRLDALDERRDRILDIARQATRPPISVIVLGTVSVVGIALLVHQLRKPRRRSISSLLAAAQSEKPKGLLSKAFERAALSFVATFAQRVGTRGLDRLLTEGPSEPHHLEVPRPRGY